MLFFSSNESIQHLFFDCHLAKSVWRIAKMAMDINIPTIVSYMMGDWLRGIGQQHKNLIFVGVEALSWAI